MRGNLLRLAVTVLLLLLVLSRVDWKEFRAVGSSVDISLVFVGYLLNLAMVGFNTLRWSVLIAPLRIPVRFGRLASYYFVCMFFNNFMPTSIGGDVVRVFDLARHTGDKSSSMASILVERLLGLYVLVPIGLGAFLILYPELPERRWFFLAEAGMALAFLLGTLLIRRRSLRKIEPLLRPFDSLLVRLDAKRKMGRLYDHLDFYKSRLGVVLLALLLSLLSRVVWVVSCYVLGRAIGIELGPVHYFLIMPLVEVGRMLPVSINGMGIREGVFLLALGVFGVGSAPAIFLSVLIYGLFLVNGIIGGLIYGLRGFFGAGRFSMERRDGTD